MPIYEYICANCQHAFDLLQKINDPPISICPKCQQNAVKRLVSAAGFQLKGTGWYETDFKNKQPADKAAAVKPSSDQPKASQVDKTQAPTTSEQKNTTKAESPGK